MAVSVIDTVTFVPNEVILLLSQICVNRDFQFFGYENKNLKIPDLDPSTKNKAYLGLNAHCKIMMALVATVNVLGRGNFTSRDCALKMTLVSILIPFYSG